MRCGVLHWLTANPGRFAAVLPSGDRRESLLRAPYVSHGQVRTLIDRKPVAEGEVRDQEG